MTEAKKPKSKTEVLTALAESTGLSKKDIANVFTQLSDLIGKEIGKKGPGVFNVPGLLKIHVVRKPATKPTTRPNPFKPGRVDGCESQARSKRGEGSSIMKSLKELA